MVTVKNVLFTIYCLLLTASVVGAYDIKYPCLNMPAADTLQVYLYDIDDAHIDLNWGTPAGGITEIANGDSTSNYWFTIAADAGHAYDIKCRTTTASVRRVAKGGLTAMETSIPTSALTVTAIRQEMDANSTKLANLDAAMTTRAPASTALNRGTWTDVKAGYLNASVAGIVAEVDEGAIADAVDTKITTSHGNGSYVNTQTGTGDVVVNHNTGGTDNLRYVDSLGGGIANASIKAFLKADYDAGRRSAEYVKGFSQTSMNGRWRYDLHLDPGFTYVIIIFKQGAYIESRKEIQL